MRATLRLLACAAWAALALGCATQNLRFAALSSETVPTLGYADEGARRVDDVSATVRSHMILWIPTNTRPPTLQDAIDAALRRGGGNVLVDAEVERWWVWVPFLYGQEGWRVRGDVVRTLGAP
jgi:hypothetical protein